MNEKIRTAFIEGRPHGHPLHVAYAKSVDAVFHYVDFKLRYHDIPTASRLRRYTSWMVCAITFPKRRSYDVFLSEDTYFMLGLMRRLGLIRKKQKLVSMMGSHTLYFLYTHQYSPRTTKAFIRLFKTYDGFICEGPTQYEILDKLLGEGHNKKIHTVYNGSPVKRLEQLLSIQPDLTKPNIVSIAGIPNQARVHYKGIDLMLEAFAIAKRKIPALTYTIVGDYDPVLMDRLIDTICPQYKHDIVFTGQTSNMGQYLENASLYLHTARGEAWGISVTEAMAAGVPTIVSEWTGAKEAVAKVDTRLVVPLEINAIAEKIEWYFALGVHEKKNLSDACKQTGAQYRDDNAIENFRQTFFRLCGELMAE